MAAEKAPPKKGSAAFPVVAAPVRRGDFNVFLTGLGSATAYNTVTIHSRVDGELSHVAFTEGQIVQKGDLLAEIDPRPFVTPMMCSRLLRPESDQRHGRLYRLSERGFDAILGFYTRTLAWVLRHQLLTLGVTVATIALTVYLYVIVPKGFFPQQDTGRLTGTIYADQKTSFQSMNALLERSPATTSRPETPLE